MLRQSLLELSAGRTVDILDRLEAARQDLSDQRRVAEETASLAESRRAEVAERVAELESARDRQIGLATQVDERINRALAEAAALEEIDGGLADLIQEEQARIAALIPAGLPAGAVIQSGPVEVTTDLAAPLLRVIDEVLFDVAHDTEQYANNRVETYHGRLKARLRPMRGLKRDRTASVVIGGHAFIQNLRRGHYELGMNARSKHLRVAAAFDELAEAI